MLGLVLQLGQPGAGDLGQLLEKDNPWHGFIDNGTPILVSVRGERIAGSDCPRWLTALEGSVEGERYEAPLAAWSPWKKAELKLSANCDDLPCDIKLDGPEVAQMAATAEDQRQTKYLDLVRERVSRYTKTQARKEYEFKGDPVDPWKTFEEAGLRSTLKRPEGITLSSRKLDFNNDQAKVIRQVLDERFARGANEAALWRRDVYTDHYFDSWGEWANVRCDAATKTIYVVQGIMVELDLMKSSSIFSKLAHGRMRSAVEDNAAIYLDRWFERVKKRALP
jgi:hypothetical protein